MSMDLNRIIEACRSDDPIELEAASAVLGVILAPESMKRLRAPFEGKRDVLGDYRQSRAAIDLKAQTPRAVTPLASGSPWVSAAQFLSVFPAHLRRRVRPT